MNDQKGFCNKHGQGVELLVVCKHLLEGTSKIYIEVDENTIFCQDCIEIPPGELMNNFDKIGGRAICRGCFNKVKIDNDLEKVKIN